jgi:hypothetical protein
LCPSIWKPYGNPMETLCGPTITIWKPYATSRQQAALVHFLKGRVMVPPFSGAAGFDPLPPCLWVTTCYNIPNAESVFHAVAFIPSVFHGAGV